MHRAQLSDLQFPDVISASVRSSDPQRSVAKLKYETLGYTFKMKGKGRYKHSCGLIKCWLNTAYFLFDCFSRTVVLKQSYNTSAIPPYNHHFKITFVKHIFLFAVLILCFGQSRGHGFIFATKVKCPKVFIFSFSFRKRCHRLSIFSSINDKLSGFIHTAPDAVLMEERQTLSGVLERPPS